MFRGASNPDKEDPEESQETNQQKRLAPAHVYRKDPQPEDGRRQRALIAGESIKSQQRTAEAAYSARKNQSRTGSQTSGWLKPPKARAAPGNAGSIPTRPSTKKEASALYGKSAGVGYALRTGIQ